MKKLIIFVLTGVLTFTIFLSGKIANAELTPVTPFYGGDIFNGQELYLFQNYSATPNFQNGYISKKTISQQDIFYEENSFYNGWYKDLGRDLIDTFTAPEHEPENPYFWFYIPLNNMTAQYLQLALIMPEPYQSDFYLKFKDHTPINFLTTNGNGDYLITPPTTNMLREIEWICYGVYYQDYLASFRPLTAQLAYDFGFSAGESQGYNNGYNTGYNNGYNNGYNDGYNIGLNENGEMQILNFNQLIDYHNIASETVNYLTFTNENNGAILVNGTASATTYKSVVTMRLIANHKYFLKGSPKNSGQYSLTMNFGGGIVAQDIGDGAFYTPSTNATVYINIRIQNAATISDRFYPMLFDTTLMFGNNDITIEEFNQLFPSKYYKYTTGENIDLIYTTGYNDGYNEGIQEGINIGETHTLSTSNWFMSIFEGIGALFNIQILPGVTIGIIVGIPFIISLAYFVIRAFRGGGGA